ncbi:MAG: hypothetical protein AAFY71_21360 [Bacteroidota bacterium]
MKKILIISFALLPLLFACGDPQENVYLYEVNTVDVEQSGVDKNNPKADLEFISLVYADLFGGTVSQSDIDVMIIAFTALGDKQLITDIIIRNMLNSPQANVPSDAQMRNDIEKFIEDTYLKFYIREPNAYEKWELQGMIEGDSELIPEMIYYAFLTSDEYRYF